MTSSSFRFFGLNSMLILTQTNLHRSLTSVLDDLILFSAFLFLSDMIRKKSKYVYESFENLLTQLSLEIDTIFLIQKNEMKRS